MVYKSKTKLNLDLKLNEPEHQLMFLKSVFSFIFLFFLREQADPEKALDLGFSIENFTYCDNIRISRRMSFIEHPIIHVELQDTERRSLILNVKVSVKPGGSLKVSDKMLSENPLVHVNPLTPEI